MKTVRVLVLFLGLFVVCTVSLLSQQKGSFQVTYNNPAGIVNTISVYVPNDYDSTQTYPFLWGWHGAGMPGSDMRNLLVSVIASKIKAIVVCPDANNVVNSTQLNNLINASYSYAATNYKTDPARTIITGFSWGGRIAFQVGLQNPAILKGIIGFSPATGPGDFVQTMWDNITKIRMATIEGDQDFNYSVVNPLMLNIKSRGANLLYLVKAGVQHADNTYFNSEEFRNDYLQCYNYIIGNVSEVAVLADRSFDLILSPNPARDFLHLRIHSLVSEPVDIIVQDVNGKILYQDKSVSPQGTCVKTIPLSGFISGMYFARISAGKNVVHRKFVKY